MRGLVVNIWLRRNRAILMAVATTVLTWACFTLARPNVALQRPCRVNTVYYAPSTCTAATVMRHDPYCVVDPTCVSWIGRDARTLYWHGLAMVGDPLLVGANPIALLSPSNYGLFVLISIDLIWFSICTLPSPRLRRLAFGVVATWYLLEIARWFEALWRFSGRSAQGLFFLDPLTYISLCSVAAPLWLSYRVATPRLKTRK